MPTPPPHSLGLALARDGRLTGVRGLCGALHSVTRTAREGPRGATPPHTAASSCAALRSTAQTAERNSRAQSRSPGQEAHHRMRQHRTLSR